MPHSPTPLLCSHIYLTTICQTDSRTPRFTYGSQTLYPTPRPQLYHPHAHPLWTPQSTFHPLQAYHNLLNLEQHPNVQNIHWPIKADLIETLYQLDALPPSTHDPRTIHCQKTTFPSTQMILLLKQILIYQLIKILMSNGIKKKEFKKKGKDEVTWIQESLDRDVVRKFRWMDKELDWELNKFSANYTNYDFNLDFKNKTNISDKLEGYQKNNSHWNFKYNKGVMLQFTFLSVLLVISLTSPSIFFLSFLSIQTLTQWYWHIMLTNPVLFPSTNFYTLTKATLFFSINTTPNPVFTLACSYLRIATSYSLNTWISSSHKLTGSL